MDDRTIHEEQTMREGITSEDSPEKVPLKKFKDYLIVETLPATGGEADAFVVKKNGEMFFLKLYKAGVEPKEEVLRKTYEISFKAQKHMVRIYEYGYEPAWKRWYEIQEYAKFGNLTSFTKNKNLYGNKNFILNVIKELSESIHFLHQMGIIHRDLKPTNILVRSDKPLDMILTDFGISSLMDSNVSKVLTTVKGTFAYSAPESFSGYFGKEIDWWAFGMIVLELITGKNPLSGLSPQVILNTLVTKSIPIPDNIPKKYRLLLMGLLTRDPKKRWSYEQVKSWIEGKKDISVYYEEVHHEYSLRDWIEAGFTEEGANIWKKVTNDPNLARALKNEVGLAPEEAKKWIEAGIRNPQVILEWRSASFESPTDVKLYEDIGLGPKQAMNLEVLGYNAKLVFWTIKNLGYEYGKLLNIGENARNKKLDLSMVFSYISTTRYYEGFFDDVIFFRDMKVESEELKQALDSGLSVSEFKSWKTNGFNIDEIIKWKRRGFELDETRQWKGVGFIPNEAVQ